MTDRAPCSKIVDCDSVMPYGYFIRFGQSGTGLGVIAFIYVLT